MNLPTFIIIGAMKTGTTSLYRYLSIHPQICMSIEKETNFFVKERSYSKGVDWYKNMFRGEGIAFGEASPNYSRRHTFSGVPERIYKLLPGVKLIYLVRDPFERIRSHYLHRFYTRYIKSSLEDNLKNIEQNDLVLTSMYSFQLSPFLELFPIEQILVLNSERLKNDRKSVLEEIFEFIGVERSFYSANYEKEHFTTEKNYNKTLIDRKIKQVRVRKGLKKIVPSFLNPKLRMPDTAISDEKKARIKDYIYPDLLKFKELTGIDYLSSF